MDFQDLSAELQSVEQSLRRRSRLSADTAFRGRLLMALRTELGQPAPISWTFLASMAAILLLGVNLAMTPSSDTRLQQHFDSEGLDIEQIVHDRELSMTIPDTPSDL
jgi:hypothetical protein